MRIQVNQDVCVGAGQCVIAARTVFDQDEHDGLVVLLHAEPPHTELESVREAVHRCPAGAIELFED
ncbi:ferredoxin [Streptomyces sp. PTY087I2]|uniref:ferredoxin n=1 Tax=Streptomyces sp. PTY087I2 TaxID=1819298 RepID=UPI00080BDD38|nr:ferredoxin [Streptomyces sp. PTY087I2]OCC14044.1 Ferredoxin-2 [Streptomyces sp. PTY087I2]